jgi:hypothetical protein
MVETIEDLYARAVLNEETGCIEWQGTQTYGSVRFHGKKIGAHRLAFMLAYNVELTPEDFVCHICDNTRCINAEHLVLGDNSTNMLDAVEKGRHQYAKQDVRGEKNGSSKLTEEDVLQIRYLVAHGKTQRATAEQFHVHESLVNHIVHRRAWAWL